MHLDIKRKNLYTSLWACRRALGKTWGFKPSIALWVYKAILLPRLTYAAIVWWPRTKKKETGNLLKSLQGSYLRAIAGSMRTTPTAALQVALGCPPLEHVITNVAKLSAYRLQCLGEWKSTGNGHTALEFLHKPPFTFTQDRIPRKYQLQSTFKVLIPARNDWKEPGFPNNLGTDIWYTDGSGNNNRFGAGFCGPRMRHSTSFSLGELATVFQAEVLAISECAKLQISLGVKYRKICICSDSRAAINALATISTESSTVWEGMQALSQLSKLNKITLIWTPGHQGVQGNEIADGLAKLGTLESPVQQIVGVPFVLGKKHIKESLERQHLTSWTEATGCRQVKLLIQQPSASRTKELLAISRKKIRTCIGLLTGHITLRAHLHKLDRAEQINCRLCGEEKEDSIHILCRCPVLALKRYRIWGKMFLRPSDLKGAKMSNLCGLLANAELGLIE
nr:uncharacterized protein LOC117601763 [Osmia lignaria]